MGTKHRGSPSGPADLEKTTVAVAFGSVSTKTVKRVTATLLGLRTTDIVDVQSHLNFVGVDIGIAGARVSADDEIEVSLVNPSAGTVTASTQTLTVLIQRFTS